jgi:Cyclin
VKNIRAVDIAFFTDGSCTTQEICAMELKICTELDFCLQTVTSFHFLDHFLDMSLVSGIIHDNDIHDAAVRYNPKLHAMAMFVIETALVIPALVDVKDSLIAAASLYLARALIGVSDAIWNDDLIHRTGYGAEQLAETVTLLHRCHKNISHQRNLKSIFKKYNSATYHYVALKTSIIASDLKLC